MTDKETLEKNLQEQIDLIEEAIAKTQRDEIVDLGTMDDQVAAICKDAVRLEAQAAKHLEGKMGEMIAALEMLESELKDFQQRAQQDSET